MKSMRWLGYRNCLLSNLRIAIAGTLISAAAVKGYGSMDASPTYTVVGTNNPTTDTTNLQAAINTLGTAGGTIRTTGAIYLSSASLTFPGAV